MRSLVAWIKAVMPGIRWSLGRSVFNSFPLMPLGWYNSSPMARSDAGSNHVLPSALEMRYACVGPAVIIESIEINVLDNYVAYFLAVMLPCDFSGGLFGVEAHAGSECRIGEAKDGIGEGINS